MSVKRLLSTPITLVLLIAALVTSGCTKSELSGNVYLTYGGGDVKPIAGTEIYLRAGTEGDLKRAIGEPFAEWANGYLRDRVASAKSSESIDLEKRLEALDTELKAVSSQYSWALDAETANCDGITAAEFSKTQADPSKDIDIRAALATYESDTASANRQLAALKKKLAASNAARLEQLKKEYIDNKLTISWKRGPSFDYERTVTVSNRGSLAVRAMDTSLAINGTILRDPEIARSGAYRFGTGIDFKTYHRRNRYGEYNLGLAPGETGSFGVEIRHKNVSGDALRNLERMGFSKSQLANAQVVIVDTDLTADLTRVIENIPPAVAKFPEQPLNVVFEKDLAATHFPEEDQIQRINAELNAARKRLEPLKELLDTCDRFNGLVEQRTDAKAHLDGLSEVHPKQHDNGEYIALAQAIRIRPHTGVASVRGLMKGEIKEFGADVEYWNAGDDAGEIALTEIFANAMLSAEITRTDINGAYAFTDLRRGNYVLITSTTTNDEDEVWWFVPVSVQGKTTQELANFKLMQGNLVTHIAQMAIAYLKGNDGTVTND